VNNLSVDQIGKFLDELNDTGADIDSEDDILLN
jgi:hypothetical protein